MTNNEKTHTYALLDCGDGRRLERFGEMVVDRPAPVATWARALPDAVWQSAVLRFLRTPGDPGIWEGAETCPDDWRVQFDNVCLQLKCSAQGQVGVFPEQLPNWRWITETIRMARRPVSILNGFAYTGAATLAASAAGTNETPATLCHVDAAKPVVGWARSNAEASGLAERPIRWIVEDVPRFLEREQKRERRYDGLILDPPAFGRGPKGTVWKLERDLPGLLEAARACLAEAPLFVLLSCHAPGWTPQTLATSLRQMTLPGGTVECGELAIHAEEHGNDLPAGLFARWHADEPAIQ